MRNQRMHTRAVEPFPPERLPSGAAPGDHPERAASSLQVKATDQYGRTVGQCSVGGRDLGDYMVRGGFAVAYRQYSKAYVEDEDLARSEKAGIW